MEIESRLEDNISSIHELIETHPHELLLYCQSQSTLPLDERDVYFVNINKSIFDIFDDIVAYQSAHCDFILLRLSSNNYDLLNTQITLNDWVGIQREAIATGIGFPMIVAMVYGIKHKQYIQDYVQEIYELNPNILPYIMRINLDCAMKLINLKSDT